MCGTIIKTLGKHCGKYNRTVAVPTVLYGCETIRQSDGASIQSAKMTFQQEKSDRNDDLRKEINVLSLREKMYSYRNKWDVRLLRMEGETGCRR